MGWEASSTLGYKTTEHIKKQRGSVFTSDLPFLLL